MILYIFNQNIQMNQIITKKDSNTFIFIRHGQSVHNIRSQGVYLKHGSNYRLTPQYKSIRLDPDLIDGEITQKGHQQAHNVKQLLKDTQFDIVLVSPLRRALQTCDIIFGDRKNIKIIIQPLISQCLYSAVDIGGRIKQSYLLYGNKFDFKKLGHEEIEEQSWYLNLIRNLKTRQLIKQKKQKQKLSYPFATLSVIKTNQLQNYKELKERVKQVKKILQEYKNTAKKICVIGHGALFKTLTAKTFNKYTHSPENGKIFQNCIPEQIEIDFNIEDS